MSNVNLKLENGESQQLPIKLIYATKSKYEKDWHSTIHMHPFTEIFYVVKGKGSFIVEDGKINVFEDDLVIVNSNVSHTESSYKSSPLEYIVLGFEGMSLILDDGNGQDHHQGFSRYNYKNHRTDVLFFMELILKELKNKEKYFETICQNLLQILIMNIIRNTHTKKVIAPDEDVNTECSYIKKYIDNYYASDITLDHLSSLVFINKYSLIRDFKKYIGLSPIEYLIQKRLEIAKSLLETTDYSMRQIAEIIGFTSQSYFNQLFKIRIGQTPGEYRISNKQSKKPSKKENNLSN